MSSMKITIVLSFLLLLSACGDDVIVKPAAKLRLDYAAQEYQYYISDCPFQFGKNTEATADVKQNCWLNLEYPKMNATVYLTYQTVKENNLDSLLYDAQKLTYDHTVKADAIPEMPFVNPDDNVYGMFYPINGNAATQAQFYVTDSINHFITASLYFESKPNFDSIYPAVIYLRNDMRRIMESMTWKENN